MSGVEKKGAPAAEAKEEQTQLGPRAKDGEHVFAVYAWLRSAAPPHHRLTPLASALQRAHLRVVQR